MIASNVLRWDCVCDACDREGRYHTIGQGKDSPPQKPPKWPQKSPMGPLWLFVIAVLVLGLLFVKYLGLWP